MKNLLAFIFLTFPLIVNAEDFTFLDATFGKTTQKEYCSDASPTSGECGDKSKLPEGIDFVVPVIINGTVHGFGIMTSGFHSQNAIFDKLKLKFGTPTEFVIKDVQNGFGNHFNIINAEWIIGDIQIFFLGSLNKLDSGFISVNDSISRKNQDETKKPDKNF